ncbi:hypothetical protein EG329_008504 [Mollisiaceae sp. DMI_Dod_QoI]|nr:hypothetical protein EG329_008504 [Helotiales sp. DMI_Dod_QoI]
MPQMPRDIEMESPKVDSTVSQEENSQLHNDFEAHKETIVTPEERKAEKRLVLKIDLMVLPLLVLSVVLASLDRGDTGYTYNAGMGEQLDISSSELSAIISMFFVGYFAMSLPSTLFLKKITGNVQIAVALWSWGTFSAHILTATSWKSLVGLRFLIGGAEALNQAAGLYLTFFYKRDQLASRGAFYFGVYALAGSMNGLLAYGIVKNLNRAGGWLPWKWIFLIEGIVQIFNRFGDI